jgi:hypothetical protein
MTNPLTRWFSGTRDEQTWAAAAKWARQVGHRFAHSRDGSGFVIEPADVALGWRLEWGSPMRHYISSPELRLRAEVGDTDDLLMLVMTRQVMTLLEQQVFDEFTESTQTRMDDDTPEEMRWLVLYPKLPRSEMGVLREQFGALSNLPRAAARWLEGPLSEQLSGAASWLTDELPLALVMQRGRLTMRCAMPQPQVPALQAALGLFDVALTAARRVGEEVARGTIGRERPSSWGPASAMPAPENTPG